MNYPGLLYPGYFLYYPMIVVQQETCTAEPSDSLSTSTIPPPKKHDLANCERSLQSFLSQVRESSLGEILLDWESLLPRVNRKSIPSI